MRLRNARFTLGGKLSPTKLPFPSTLFNSSGASNEYRMGGNDRAGTHFKHRPQLSP